MSVDRYGVIRATKEGDPTHPNFHGEPVTYRILSDVLGYDADDDFVTLGSLDQEIKLPTYEKAVAQVKSLSERDGDHYYAVTLPFSPQNHLNEEELTLPPTAWDLLLEQVEKFKKRIGWYWHSKGDVRRFFFRDYDGFRILGLVQPDELWVGARFQDDSFDRDSCPTVSATVNFFPGVGFVFVFDVDDPRGEC